MDNKFKLTGKKFFIFALSVYVCSCSSPQRHTGYEENSPPFIGEKFYIDPLVFFENDSLKPRLDIYIEIPTDNLLYLLNNSGMYYESKIEISFTINNTTGKQILYRTFEEFTSYSEEQIKQESKSSQYFFYNFILEPGFYNLSIRVKDNNSGKEYTRSSEIRVNDFSTHDISSSDIMILSRYKISKDGTNEITPLVNNNIFGMKDFYVFFELYGKQENAAPEEYYLILKDNKNKEIFKEPLYYTLPPGINKKIEKIDAGTELRKYIPEEPDFDFFIFDNDNLIFFTLELWRKSTNEISANKMLFFYPKLRPGRDMRGRDRRGGRPE